MLEIWAKKSRKISGPNMMEISARDREKGSVLCILPMERNILEGFWTICLMDKALIFRLMVELSKKALGSKEPLKNEHI